MKNDDPARTVRPTRRDLLRRGAGAATLLASGAAVPAFLGRTASVSAEGLRGDERILVVVQLTGGNDGLNTVIPFRNDAYHRARPTLAVPAGRALKLNDELGLHPQMASFKQLYDDGQLHVIGNVGYPNPNRSHFRSMDIWHTASIPPRNTDDGWLGRVTNRQSKLRDTPFALHLDDGVLPLALHTTGTSVPSVRNIDAFRLDAGAGPLEAAIAPPRTEAGDDLLFIQRVALSSCANARRLARITAQTTSETEYPAFPLARRLQQIATLIGAGFGPHLYYTSLGGFDTHARQADTHGPLLRELSASTAAFFKDLAQRKVADRVLLMTFSEFGRRVAENGSKGTDHGAAAPMFVVGPACRPGITGDPPDLDHLNNGDIRHEIDFRSVYAAVLQEWMKIDPAPVLGRRFNPVDIIRRT